MDFAHSRHAPEVKGAVGPRAVLGINCQGVPEESEMGAWVQAYQREEKLVLGAGKSFIHPSSHLRDTRCAPAVCWALLEVLGGCSSERDVLGGEGGEELVTRRGSQHVRVTRHPSAIPLFS